MNNIVKITLVLLASAAALAAGIYHYKTSATVQPSHAVIARDRSDSVLTDCGCTEALMKKALDASNMGRGSTVTVIASGDESTADEPVLVGSFDVPTTRQVIEGRGAKRRKQEALLAVLKTKCEALSVTKRSPIALLIRRGVERLRQVGCNLATSGCAVWVQTDADETAEAQLKKLLDGNRPNKQGAARPLIDNHGIDVVFYGLSQTVGEREMADGRRHQFTRERDNRRAERIRDGWLSVFTDPGRVRFEPFCPTN
jgi:hypothetical protein